MTTQNTHSAVDIAKVILAKGKQNGQEISHKKLQKLVYYTQVWSLVLNKEPLIKERFEAWVHGPVVPALYRKYSGSGDQNLSLPEKTPLPQLSKKQERIIDSVMKTYGKYDAHYLEALTHSEKPWQDARRGLGTFEGSKNVISKNSIIEYYSELYRKTKQA